jgi:lipid-A-disaccharide synthase-like uncharacterized protein
MLADGHIQKLLQEFQNPLVFFGLLGQSIFMFRFVVQWYASEKRGVVQIPVAFWYFSIVGSLMTIVYAVLKPELVLLFAQSLGLFIYVRNLMIVYGLTRKSRLVAGRKAAAATNPNQPSAAPAAVEQA